MKTFASRDRLVLVALILVLITGNVAAQSNSIQSATGNTAGNADTTFTVNLPSVPSNGNTLIAVISTRGTSDDRVSSIAQTNVTNWKRVIQRTNTYGVTTEIWYAPNTVSAGKSVTINLASLRAAAVVMEYSGVLIPDATATQIQNNSTPSTGTPWDGTKGIPTTKDNEVWVGSISVSLAGGDRTLTGVYNDFSIIGGNPVTSGATTPADTKLYALDRIVDFTQAPNSGGRLSGTAQWAGAIATFMKTTFARVQSSTGNSGTNGVNSFNVTLPNNTTIGNTLIAVISTRGTTAGRVSEITGGGATWIRAIEATRSNSSGNTTEIWYAPITSTSVPKTVTIKLAATLRAAAVVMEYRGILTDVSPVDQTAVANGSSSTNPTVGPSALTTQENELWIGGIGYSSSSPTLGSLTNSFSEIANSASTSGTSSNNAKVYALEKNVTTTGTASTGGTLTVGVQWSGAIATFITPIAAPYCNVPGTSTPVGWTDTKFTGARGYETTVPVNVTTVSSNIYKGVKNSFSIDVYAGENMTINHTCPTDAFKGLYCTYYADWNQNKIFEDSEKLGQMLQSTGSTTTLPSVQVPTTASLGTTRVRVMFSKDATASPCSISTKTNAMVCDFNIKIKKWCPPDIVGRVKNESCPEVKDGTITIDNVNAIKFENNIAGVDGMDYIETNTKLMNKKLFKK